jgi:exosortase/archaeosortase family protein
MADPPAGPWRSFVARAAAWMGHDPRRQRRVQLLAALLAFQGTAFVLVANKLVVLHPGFIVVGFAMIVAGVFLLLVRELDAAARGVAPPPAPSGGTGPTLAERLVARVTLGGRLNSVFAVVGLAIIGLDLLYNQFLSPTPALLSTDVVVIGLGVVLVAFPFVPQRFHRERNFAVLFFAALALVFGVPLMLLRLGQDPYASVDEYTAALLAPQLSWFVNLFGMNSFYSGNILYYIDQTNGNLASVYIATSCSGLYSMGIFIAAFLALVLTEYAHLSWRVGALMALGVLIAYGANLLRMAIIVEVGYHYGGEALLWTHANLGDLIFLAWVAPFVWLTYRVLDPSAGGGPRVDGRAFEQALREQGIDPALVGESDWFCAACFLHLEAGGPEGGACPRCGASLA